MYRARIGVYYSKVLAKTRKITFLDRSLIVQFLILSCLHHPCSITLSVFAHLLAFFDDHKNNSTNSSVPTDPTDRFINNDRGYKGSVSIQWLRLLLFLCGDVEVNPGPTPTTDLKIVHINARSIRNKMQLIQSEYHNIDIITVSETWLSETDHNSSIHLTNFHPPIRGDRPHDPHGGVAIYVRNDLYCTARPDLHVSDLEAVCIKGVY